MTRDEALKKMQAVKSYMTSGNPIWSVTEIGEAFDMAIEALEQPERKTGKWINEGAYSDYTNICAWHCSECGEHITAYPTELDLFCRHCGAKMEGEEYG